MRAALLALGSLALLACGEDSTSPPLATPSDVLIVSGASGLGANAYDPNNLTFSLASKQTVKWRNDDGTTHTVTADTGAFDSGNINGGEIYSHTFVAAGTYAYHCKIHTTMKGTIVVLPLPSSADVSIVPGASSKGADAYAPNPHTISLATSGSVEWGNADGTNHTVTSDDGAFDSGNLPSGSTFTHTFAAPGNYPYHCTIHPTMVGTITVNP